jgi:putative endonuclease
MRLASKAVVAGNKRFVYVLRNADQNPHFYVGLTSDVNARLADHNAGRCPHTVSRRPWQRHVVIEFPDEKRAIRFESYLKSGSGRAFAKRHLEPQSPFLRFDQLSGRGRKRGI